MRRHDDIRPGDLVRVRAVDLLCSGAFGYVRTISNGRATIGFRRLGAAIDSVETACLWPHQFALATRLEPGDHVEFEGRRWIIDEPLYCDPRGEPTFKLADERGLVDYATPDELTYVVPALEAERKTFDDKWTAPPAGATVVEFAAKAVTA